jgi:hypothetical protein
MLLTTQSVVTIAGLCIAYWLDYGTSFANESPLQWRLPMGFQGFFALCLVIQVVMLPESPRWLVQQGHNNEAAEVIAALEGKEFTVDHPTVIRLRTEIETAVELESVGGPFRISELFEMGKIQNFRRIVLSIAIEFMQQFTGSSVCISTHRSNY